MISSQKEAQFNIRYSNGNWISMIWGEGSHTTNGARVSGFDDSAFNKEHATTFNNQVSDTVEIWLETEDESLQQWISDEFNQGELTKDPIGYVPVERIAEILQRVQA